MQYLNNHIASLIESEVQRGWGDHSSRSWTEEGMKVKELSSLRKGEEIDQNKRREWKENVWLKEEVLWARDKMDIWTPFQERTLAMLRAPGKHQLKIALLKCFGLGLRWKFSIFNLVDTIFNSRENSTNLDGDADSGLGSLVSEANTVGQPESSQGPKPNGNNQNERSQDPKPGCYLVQKISMEGFCINP